MANGVSRYVGSNRRKLSPTQFAPVQQSEGRIFTDYDGTVYEVIWPRGRMLLSELGRESDAVSEQSR